jgi:NAD(P)-dependent dehydrogenase (short-subunit alcohol dehydrogenase family)
MEVKGRTVLITGGARRVGKTIALTLASKGANVAITYNRSHDDAEQTVAEIRKLGVRGEAFRCDVRQWNEVRSTVCAVIASLGHVDVLVNNAAIFPRTPFLSLNEKQWDEVIDTNLKGPFMFARFVGEAMLEEGRGKIINIADCIGMRPYVDYLPYCVSKAGVIALTQVLAKTLAPHVQVNAIAPGPVLMPEEMSEDEISRIRERVPLKQIGSPQDIANTVVFLIEGSDFITGAVFAIDGGRCIA